MRTSACTAFLLLALLPAFCRPAVAYEKMTHALLTSIAVENSRADDVLREQLGLDGGTSVVSGDRELRLWAEAGSKTEDDFPRFANHFHDPLRAWDEAGWRASLPYLPLLGLRLGDSSVVWAQRDEPRQGWSWNHVRRTFFQALTGRSKAERDEALALTFEGLGRLAHLLQDAASPAHTRNDPHVRANYETFVGKLADADLRSLVGSPVAPDPGWVNLPQNAAAPAPVSALFDADVYVGSNPQATIVPLIGLTEYTNANFFSEDSVFGRADIVGRRFAYPARESTTIIGEPVTLPSAETVQRLYYRKGADGDTGYRLATVGLLREHQALNAIDPARIDRKPFLDDAVYSDYAARLLPRAIGYSTALVDHFFRGRLGASISPYGDAIFLMVQNLTSEPMEGVFELHAIRGDERELVATFGSAETPRLLGPWGWLPEVLPTTFRPAKRFILVFRGRMGTEGPDAARVYPGAVAAVVFDVQFVFTVQQSFQGPTAQFRCESHRSSSPTDHSESLRCYWLPLHVRIPGYFRTNWDKPIIQRIHLEGGRIPVLVVDGVPQPRGEWVREREDQADPQTFLVTEVGIESTPFYWVFVETKEGTLFETQLATIDIGGSFVARSKEYVQQAEAYLVQSDRNSWMEVASETTTDSVETARFRTQSINGRSNPTEGNFRVFAGILYPEGVRVDDESWEEDVIDVFTSYTTSSAADSAYDALPGLDVFVDPILENRPSVAWTASIARDYTPTELDFFRLFEITPISYVIPLSGR